ncbi:MAG: hypothetical protein NT005_16675 [Spirochaetes bacterium]|nr:hypothetical protein [Spirochaetota bacterium]
MSEEQQRIASRNFCGGPEVSDGKSKDKRNDCPLMTVGLVVDAGIGIEKNLVALREAGFHYICVGRGKVVKAEGEWIFHCESSQWRVKEQAMTERSHGIHRYYEITLIHEPMRAMQADTTFAPVERTLMRRVYGNCTSHSGASRIPYFHELKSTADRDHLSGHEPHHVFASDPEHEPESFEWSLRMRPGFYSPAPHRSAAGFPDSSAARCAPSAAGPMPRISA